MTDPIDAFVVSLLTDGPATHTIVCPTCEGTGQVRTLGFPEGKPCPYCFGGRQTVIVRAELT